MKSINDESNELPNLWYIPGSEKERSLLKEELQKEVGEGHILWRADYLVFARRDDRDDILIVVEGKNFSIAEVHLTWSGKQEENPRWPRTQVFLNIKDWLLLQDGYD